MGIALIVAGVAVLGANFRYGTHVILTVTQNHGLHETDIGGAVLVFAGTALRLV